MFANIKIVCIFDLSNKQKLKIMTTTKNTITANTTLTARSIGDYNCIFSVEILDRKKSFVTVKAMGSISRVKVYSDDKGEFIYAFGKYSMAPIFRA